MILWTFVRLSVKTQMLFNPCHVTGVFPYPLKTSETPTLCSFIKKETLAQILGFSDVFRGYKKTPVTWYGLTCQDKFFSLKLLCLFQCSGWVSLTVEGLENSKLLYYIKNVAWEWTVLFSAGDTLKLKSCSKSVYFVIARLYLNI